MADGAALNKILTRELNDFLYPDNNVIKGNGMFDAQGSSKHVVEVNESAEQPLIQENPTVFPLPVHSTEDSVLSYSIDSMSTEATFINDVDEMLTVFSKRANELKKHAKAMETQYTDKILYNWALPVSVTGSFVETTGAAAAVLNGNMTGTRKVMTRDDVIKAKTILAKQEVDTDNLVMLMDTAMYYNVYELDEFILYTSTGSKDPAGINQNGAIGSIFGMQVFVRNGGTFYGKTLNVKQSYLNSDGTRYKGAADDNLSVMIWNPAYVRYSFGDEKTYTEIDSPVYQGSVFSTKLRCGAARSRSDNKGVVMIVQDWVS
jgi:hypothetical protein